MPNTNPIIFEVQRGSPLPELLAECGMISYRLARRRCPITEVLTEQGTIAHPPACRPRHGRNLRIQTAVRLRDRHRSSDDRCLTRAGVEIGAFVTTGNAALAVILEGYQTQFHTWPLLAQSGHWLKQQCPKSAQAPQQLPALLDHLVGAQQERFRYREAERLGCFEIHD